MNEILSWRTAQTKHFDKGDGVYEARVYSGPVHFLEGENWQEYTTSSTIREHCGWERLCFDGSPMKVRIGDNPATPESELVEVAVTENGREYWLTMKAIGQVMTPPVVDGQHIRWHGIDAGVDLVVEIDPHGKLSRKWYFYQGASLSSIDSLLLCTDLHVEALPDGSLILASPSRTYFTLPVPYLESSRGNRYEGSIPYKVTPSGPYFQIEKVVDDAALDWIEEEFELGALWVMLDPTITIPEYSLITTISAVNIAKNLSGTSGPTSNKTSNTIFRYVVGVHGTAVNQPLYRLLMKYDLTDPRLQEASFAQAPDVLIPRGVKFSIIRAFLQFFHKGGTLNYDLNSGAAPLPGSMLSGGVSDNNIDVRCHRILKNWTYVSASDNIGPANWNQPVTGQPTWDGCPDDDTNATINASAWARWVSSATVGNALDVLDVTNDVIGFLNGTYTNYGWVLRGINEALGDDQFIGIVANTANTTIPGVYSYTGYRPNLTIQYSLTQAKPSLVSATSRSITIIDLNIETDNTQEDYTVLYSRSRVASPPGTWSTWTEITSSKLRPRERAFSHTGLVLTNEYGYLARSLNELRSIGWPIPKINQLQPNNCRSNADTSFSFKPSASASTTVTLPSAGSATNDYYKDWQVYVYSGTGVGETKLVTAYDGMTKILTVNTAWTANPATTSVIILRPYIPPSEVFTDYASISYNYDYRVAVASTDGAGTIQTVRIYRKRSMDAVFPTTAQQIMSPPQTAKNASSAVTFTGHTGANLHIWFSSLSNYPINHTGAENAETIYWDLSCYGGWSEFSDVVTAQPIVLDAFTGTFTVGGASRDLDFDEFPTTEGFMNSQMQGPAEQQYVTLEGTNFVYDPVGSYVSGVKDLGIGTTCELIDFSTTDYIGGAMTTDAVVDTSYLQADRDPTVTAQNQKTLQVRTSDTPPTVGSSWTAWTAAYGAGGAWSDKGYPHFADSVWGLNADAQAKFEFANGGFIDNIAGQYTVTKLVASTGTITSSMFGTFISGTNPINVRRGFFSVDISGITLENLSDQAFLYIPVGQTVSATNKIYIYAVDFGNPLTVGAYTQDPDYGLADSVIYSGNLRNELSDYYGTASLTIKGPDFIGVLRRHIINGKKFLRCRIQMQNEGVSVGYEPVTLQSTTATANLRLNYKLILPYVQILDAQRLPTTLRKRYMQFRAILWRGQSPGETP